MEEQPSLRQIEQEASQLHEKWDDARQQAVNAEGDAFTTAHLAAHELATDDNIMAAGRFAVRALQTKRELAVARDGSREHYTRYPDQYHALAMAEAAKDGVQIDLDDRQVDDVRVLKHPETNR